MTNETNNDRVTALIKVTKNGPYIVSGGASVSEQIIGINADAQSQGWREGKKFPVGEAYALCRCGGSKNKPFCDGSHLINEFNGTETAPPTPFIQKITGPGLDLIDAESLCASARFCDRAGGIRTLIDNSDNDSARKIAVEEGCDCPSGRLTVCNKDGHKNEPALPPSIGAVEDTQMGCLGPLWVRGGIPVQAADGATYEVRNRTTLCRCGKSTNKPFCDGSHLPQS